MHAFRGMHFGSWSGRVVEDRYQGVDDPAPGEFCAHKRNPTTSVTHVINEDFSLLMQ